jgi:hypothetical protein
MTTNKTTLKILAMPNTLTNRQVADALGLEIETVKNTRRNHKVNHTKVAKDRGYKDKILSYPNSVTSQDVATNVGCSVWYVYAVRHKAKQKD